MSNSDGEIEFHDGLNQVMRHARRTKQKARLDAGLSMLIRQIECPYFTGISLGLAAGILARVTSRTPFSNFAFTFS